MALSLMENTEPHVQRFSMSHTSKGVWDPQGSSWRGALCYPRQETIKERLMEQVITKRRLAVFSLIVYTVLNLKFVLSVLLTKGWWMLVFTTSANSASTLAISVVLGLFLNVAVVLVYLERSK